MGNFSEYLSLYKLISELFQMLLRANNFFGLAELQFKKMNTPGFFS